MASFWNVRWLRLPSELGSEKSIQLLRLVSWIPPAQPKRDFQKENSTPTVGPFSVKLSPIRLALVSLLTTRRLPNW